VTDRARLAPHLDALAGASVLCVGDAMLDRFVYGDVERVSPEAPIPVLCIQRETAMPGGAANVVRNLAGLGVRSDFVSVAGDDDAGRELHRLLQDRPNVSPHLELAPGRRTTIKTRYIAAGQQLIRTDYESVQPISDGVAQALIAAASARLPEVDALVVSDYAKGVLSPSVIQRLISMARDSGMPVLVDPKGADYERYHGATVITPNQHELAAATGRRTETDEELVQAGRQLIPHCADAVVVTRGGSGMALITKGDSQFLRAERREVFDVSGAGDTVIAVLGAALGARVPLLEATTLANLAAGIAVSKLGTAEVRADELRNALRHRELMNGEAKVVGLPRCLESVEQWRRSGLEVGFTNGCFDLLHPGHVSLLSQARAACDRLVVGLNDDASTSRLKGPERPVQPESARASVLASLADVDLVVLFSEDTPLSLIEAIRPDVLVKGADWSADRIAGADWVSSYGGRVLLAELSPGYSTTSTISRLAR
jgi:D-beta-D-heptose 7-phosphate kinase/D-beta-D-heptose 1-phosphate adenosyltransferase